MQTTILTQMSDFEALAEAWDDLLARAITAPFFMRYAYQHAWWTHLGEGDLLLLTVRTPEGQLVGLAPLFGRTDEAGQRVLSLVGCVDVSDYLDILIDRRHVDAVQTAILTCLADPQVAWDKLFLCSLPHSSLTHRRLAGLAQQKGWQVAVKEQIVCPVITLADTWEDYLAGIDKKQRHEIRRKMRKLEREVETNWYALQSEEGLDEALADFFELHRMSTPDKEDFWSDDLVRFFTDVTHAAAKEGYLRLFFMEIDGVRQAAMLCFDYHNEFLLYNSGYNPDLSKLSVGNVLTSYTIQQAIELGRTRYDFLRGDEEYKFRFGADPEPVHDVTIVRA